MFDYGPLVFFGLATLSFIDCSPGGGHTCPVAHSGVADAPVLLPVEALQAHLSCCPSRRCKRSGAAHACRNPVDWRRGGTRRNRTSMPEGSWVTTSRGGHATHHVPILILASLFGARNAKKPPLVVPGRLLREFSLSVYALRDAPLVGPLSTIIMSDEHHLRSGCTAAWLELTTRGLRTLWQIADNAGPRVAR